MIDNIEFPEGDGDTNCSICRGRGVVDYTPEGALVPGVRTCPCVQDRDIRLNLDRGWRGLSRVEPVDETLLTEYLDSDLWVTAPHPMFQRHLYTAVYTKGPWWKFQVSSDADMMDAWLSRIPTDEIHDPDVGRIRAQQVSHRYPALVDLVEPPELLVVCVSVKVARNVAMPEVLLEALQHRDHLDKPTWIIDKPDRPLTTGHIAYSEEAGSFLADWPHIQIVANKVVEEGEGGLLRTGPQLQTLSKEGTE